MRRSVICPRSMARHRKSANIASRTDVLRSTHHGFEETQSKTRQEITMAVLSSKLFTDGDPAVVKKLEDCATGRPSEVASHFTLGQSGEHIRRVQEALRNVQDLEPDLGIPDFTVNGTYDNAFAQAIAVYKE